MKSEKSRVVRVSKDEEKRRRELRLASKPDSAAMILRLRRAKPGRASAPFGYAQGRQNDSRNEARRSCAKADGHRERMRRLPRLGKSGVEPPVRQAQGKPHSKGTEEGRALRSSGQAVGGREIPATAGKLRCAPFGYAQGRQNDRRDEARRPNAKDERSKGGKEVDARAVWMHLEDRVVPRLRLSVIERAVYAHLLRHTRLEGRVRVRFSIVGLGLAVERMLEART